MDEVPVLFEQLRPSCEKPKAGDVFAYKITGYAGYCFGRVMRDDAIMVVPEQLVLVFYKATSRDINTVPKLDGRRMLIPPVITDSLMWELGFFVTVDHIPLNKRARQRRFCFYDDTYVDGTRYYDEYERRLERRIRPCGELVSHSPHTLSFCIARALGAPVPQLRPEVDECERQMQKLAKKASWLDIEKCTTPELRRCLKELLDDLDKIGRKHDGLFDTDVREKLYEAVFRAFVMQEGGYEIPDELCMFSPAGNKAVHRALERFVMAARTEVERAGKRLNTPAKRLCAFEDLTIESREGEGFDTFFGALVE